MRVLALVLSLFSLACADTSHHRHHHHRAKAAHLRERKQDVDTARLVSAIQQVVTNLEAEQDQSKVRSKLFVDACEGNQSALEDAIKNGHHTLEQAKADLEAASAEAEELEAAIEGIKGDVSASNSELDALQGRLKDLRENMKNSQSETQQSLQQIKQVIMAGELNSQSDQHHHRHHHHHHKSALKSKVNDLRELSQELAESASPAAFMQVKSKATHAHHAAKHTNQHQLEEDQEEVQQAGEASRDEMDEEERKILELIRIEREKLAKAEGNLKNKQPALADQLSAVADANRTAISSTRGLVRDGKLLSGLQAKCTMVKTASEGHVNMRDQVLQQLRMAVKMMESMDAALFLARDIHGLKDAPAFVQVSAKAKSHSSEGAPKVVQDILRSLSDGSAAPKDSDIMGLVQQAVAAQGNSKGPFDEVNQMIQGLIDNLKAQLNEEVDHNSFCHDSLAKNRQNRLNKVNQIDMKKSEIRWAEAAVTKLGEEVDFIESEISRLESAMKANNAELEAESSRVASEVGDHEEAQNVITEVITVLVQLCGLDASASSFVQQAKSKKFNSCQEAKGLLDEASSKLSSLDNAMQAYKDQYESAVQTTQQEAEESLRSRNSERVTSETAKATRASELAEGKEELKVATKELELIQQAKTQLETECSPAAESREDRMARRDEEIKHLKEALAVLEGESMAPVGGSFVQQSQSDPKGDAQQKQQGKVADANDAKPAQQNLDVEAQMMRALGDMS